MRSLLLAHRGLLMGRIKKKQTIMQLKIKNLKMYKNVQQSNEKIFCFKNKFLNFSETKKFSTESFLTFRELHPLVSYKRVSYKKNTCILVRRRFGVFIINFEHISHFILEF